MKIGTALFLVLALSASAGAQVTVTIPSGATSVVFGGFASSPGTAALSAFTVTRGFCANTKLVAGWDSLSQVENAISYLGIPCIREEATHAGTGNYDGSTSSFNEVHAATGVMIDMVGIVDDGTTPSGSCHVSTSNPYCGAIADDVYALEQIKAMGALIEAEGPNEPNNFPFTYYTGSGNYACDSSTWEGCGLYMRDFEQAVHGATALSGVAVADLTEGGGEVGNWGLQFLTIPSGAGTNLPDGTVMADLANLHNYAVGTANNAAYADNQDWAAEAPSDSECSSTTCIDGVVGNYLGSTWAEGFTGYAIGTVLPRVTTETGFQTNTQYSADQQGKALTNLYLSAAARGWMRTFMYTMFDESNDGTTWGFYQSNHTTPKLSGVYMHNLTAALSDTAAGSTSSVNYSISPAVSTVHSLLMEKSNGKFDLAVWDDRPVGEATDNVTVSFGSSYSYTVSDIVSGSITSGSASSVSLSLTDHAVVIEF